MAADPNVVYADYGYNCIASNPGSPVGIGTVNNNGKDDGSQALSAIQSPATTYILTELNATNGADLNTYTTSLTDFAGTFPPTGQTGSVTWGGNPTMPGNVDPRHTNGSNFLFYDGHVKWQHTSLDINGNPCGWYLTKPQSNGAFPGCQ